MDFVQVVDKNTKEAIFYYENNWKVLREMALEKDYIASFQLLETTPTESEPFQFILITTYKDKEQYELREAHFSELIQERAELKLLNEKKPGEFRKTLFSREMVIHLE